MMGFMPTDFAKVWSTLREQIIGFAYEKRDLLAKDCDIFRSATVDVDDVTAMCSGSYLHLS